MNINNPAEAFNLIQTNNLIGMCPEAQQVIVASNVLMRMCPCCSKDEKNLRYEQFKTAYINFVKKAVELKLTKDGESVSFYLDNKLIE